jgi:hypothetical protein
VKRLNVFFVFILLVACSDRSGVPDDVLPLDSMRHVLKDVMAVDNYSDQYLSKDSLVKDKVKANQELLEVIFKLHHTSRTEFKKSLEFYESRPDLNKKIFDSLSAYANVHKAELYAPALTPKGRPVPVK